MAAQRGMGADLEVGLIKNPVVCVVNAELRQTNWLRAHGQVCPPLMRHKHTLRFHQPVIKHLVKIYHSTLTNQASRTHA